MIFNLLLKLINICINLKSKLKTAFKFFKLLGVVLNKLPTTFSVRRSKNINFVIRIHLSF